MKRMSGTEVRLSCCTSFSLQLCCWRHLLRASAPGQGNAAVSSNKYEMTSVLWTVLFFLFTSLWSLDLETCHPTLVLLYPAVDHGLLPSLYWSRTHGVASRVFHAPQVMGRTLLHAHLWPVCEVMAPMLSAWIKGCQIGPLNGIFPKFFIDRCSFAFTCTHDPVSR